MSIGVDYFCRPCRGSLLVLLLLPMGGDATGHILPPLGGLHLLVSFFRDVHLPADQNARIPN